MMMSDEQEKLLITMDFLPVVELLGVVNDSKNVMFQNLNANQVEKIKNIFPKLCFTNDDSLNSINKWYAISRYQRLSELALESFGEKDVKKLGHLLGYPECCVEFWIRNSSLLLKKELISNSLTNTKGRPCYYNNNIYNFYSRLNSSNIKYYNQIWQKNPEFNYLLQLQLISHVPCSFGCVESKKIGHKNYKLLKKNLLDFCDWCKKSALCACFIF